MPQDTSLLEGLLCAMYMLTGAKTLRLEKRAAQRTSYSDYCNSALSWNLPITAKTCTTLISLYAALGNPFNPVNITPVAKCVTNKHRFA